MEFIKPGTYTRVAIYFTMPKEKEKLFNNSSYISLKKAKAAWKRSYITELESFKKYGWEFRIVEQHIVVKEVEIEF